MRDTFTYSNDAHKDIFILKFCFGGIKKNKKNIRTHTSHWRWYKYENILILRIYVQTVKWWMNEWIHILIVYMEALDELATENYYLDSHYSYDFV